MRSPTSSPGRPPAGCGWDRALSQEEKLIEETQVDGRKRTYRITQKGREVFQEELERLKACVLDGEEELG